MVETLLKYGITYGSGVPCSIFKDELLEIENDPRFTYVPAVDEATALGVVNGFTLGGKRAFLLTQNSAVGKVADLIASFNIPYDVPLFWIVSLRGVSNDTEVHKRAIPLTRRIMDELHFMHWDNYQMGFDNFHEACEMFLDDTEELRLATRNICYQIYKKEAK